MRGTESEEGVQGGGRGFRVLLCAAGPISVSHLHLRAAGQTQGLGLLRRQPALQCSPHCGGERDASSPSSATLLAHDPQQEEYTSATLYEAGYLPSGNYKFTYSASLYKAVSDTHFWLWKLYRLSE